MRTQVRCVTGLVGLTTVLSWSVAAVRPPAAAAETTSASLTLADLTGHPKLWPEQVTLLAPIRLKDGSTLATGAKVQLVGFDGSRIIVQNAGHDFFLAPTSCNFVDAANADRATAGAAVADPVQQEIPTGVAQPPTPPAAATDRLAQMQARRTAFRERMRAEQAAAAAKVGSPPDGTQGGAGVAVPAAPPPPHLTGDEINANPSLWPATVTLTSAMAMADGTTVAAGRPVQLVRAALDQDAQVIVRYNGLPCLIPGQQTDFFQQVEATAAQQPPSSRAEFLPSLLKGARTVDVNGNPRSVKTDGIKYFILYFGADWCPYCKPATTELAEFRKQLAGRSDIGYVVLSEEDGNPKARGTDATFLRAMADEGMGDWPIVSAAARPSCTPVFDRYFHSGLPQVTLTDHAGKILWILGGYDKPGCIINEFAPRLK